MQVNRRRRKNEGINNCSSIHTHKNVTGHGKCPPKHGLARVRRVCSCQYFGLKSKPQVMAALYMSRYKEPRVCGLDIKRTMKIGLCWGIYDGPWFLHHEEENTTELQVDQKILCFDYKDYMEQLFIGEAIAYLQWRRGGIPCNWISIRAVLQNSKVL